MMEKVERMEITYLTTAMFFDIWTQLERKSGVLLIFAFGVLGISVSRILCTYSEYSLLKAHSKVRRTDFGIRIRLLNG